MHPLSMMTAKEIKTSADILRRSGHIDSDATFHGCCIHEPPKVEVASWIAGDLADRRLDLVVHSIGETYEARVSISRGEVDRWELVPGVIPRVGFVELSRVMESCKNNPNFKKALSKRGITAASTVQFDPWPT